jgi:hypothetical protein
MRQPGILVTILLCGAVMAEGQRVDVARFSLRQMRDWHTETFSGETHYQLTDEGQRTVLHATSQGTASGLVRRITIDLNTTPSLNWSWKIGNTFTGNDERSRGGDDYPARIYVIFSGGLFFWRARAINYVWSSHQPIGAIWPNAYTSQARMIAVDSGNSKINQWVNHSRDIRADYRRLFGEEIDHVDAVAIMSDSDNTGQNAEAWYGDIWFSSGMPACCTDASDCLSRRTCCQPLPGWPWSMPGRHLLSVR